MDQREDRGELGLVDVKLSFREQMESGMLLIVKDVLLGCSLGIR